VQESSIQKPIKVNVILFLRRILVTGSLNVNLLKNTLPFILPINVAIKNIRDKKTNIAIETLNLSL
jgi:hypothetical protein